VLTPQVNNLMVFALENTIGCETWLRAVQDRRESRDRHADALAH